MPRYRVSQRAKEDLRQIGLYTQREWGKEQRRKYLSGLDNKFSFLADSPAENQGKRSDSEVMIFSPQ